MAAPDETCRKACHSGMTATSQLRKFRMWAGCCMAGSGGRLAKSGHPICHSATAMSNSKSVSQVKHGKRPVSPKPVVHWGYVRQRFCHSPSRFPRLTRCNRRSSRPWRKDRKASDISFSPLPGRCRACPSACWSAKCLLARPAILMLCDQPYGLPMPMR
jgi:hypothetical protein